MLQTARLVSNALPRAYLFIKEEELARTSSHSDDNNVCGTTQAELYINLEKFPKAAEQNDITLSAIPAYINSNHVFFSWVES